MRANFYLKEPNSKTPTNILLFFSYKGKRLKYYTGINILPKQWSKSKQIIYSGVTNSEDLNRQLRDLKTKLEKEYLQRLSNGNIPPPSYFKEFLNSRLKDEDAEADNFIAIYEAFKKDKSRVNQPNSMKRFNALYKHFSDIEKYYNIKISTHTFTKDFYQKFIDYFVFEAGQANNTIKEKHLKSLQTFLNWLVDKEYVKNNHFKGIKFPYKINPADTVYLEEDELNKLYNLDLSNNKRLEQVRDVFCIECYTGLRYSDTKKVQYHKINGRVLEIITEKTVTPLRIPLRKEALILLNKYFDRKMPLPVISNQKMNLYLKELGQVAEFNKLHTVLKVSGIKKEEFTYKKQELITTHTGRRTFVTLSYKRGMQPLDIMKITGHKHYDTFMRYYRLHEIEVTDSFFNAWEELHPKYKTEDIIKRLIYRKVKPHIIADSFGIELEEIQKLI